MIKSFIRRWIPEPVLNAYHYVLARLASVVYGQPSKQLTVIGVTGTNGKSSTTQFIGRILEHAGEKVGWTTTVGFKVGEREWTNDQKMTMLGRFQSQRLLREMVKAGCRYAIVETSSQGIVQHRNVGIDYTFGVFTNLTPEHIESHGGFENYKNAKRTLFAQVAKNHGTAIVNLMDAHAKDFLAFPFQSTWGFTDKQALCDVQHVVRADSVTFTSQGTTFEIESVPFHLKPIGRFNFENVLAAITTCRALGLSLEKICDAVTTLEFIPGRLESIEEGQPFTVIVDYAPEPIALAATYEALALIPHKRLIHVLGSTGGGRDVSRRAVLGKMAAAHADVMIVTNEDPYDDDPMQIINHIADAGITAGKSEGETLFRILDRQEAVNQAIAMANKEDLVLLTGKGSEPVMAVAHGKKIIWDDRSAARRAIRERTYG
ncbi:MAG: UDP-N-acetylmuramoyl-L-alanyl-D-glutamate--2,6-diaminopimelate ligase [Patescibacteria group bacterium]